MYYLNKKYLIGFIYIAAILFFSFYRTYGLPIFLVIFLTIIALFSISNDIPKLFEIENKVLRKLIVICVPTIVFYILCIAVLHNPYTHIIMTGDAVPHIQWARAFSNLYNFQIAAFSWDPAPEKYNYDGVFGLATDRLSAHVLYYYGYFLVAAIAAYFYKIFTFDGHHIIFVALGFYFFTGVIFYKIASIYKLGSFTLFIILLSWCVNPFAVSAILDGGKFEVILFPVYLGFLVAIIRNRYLFGFLFAGILIFTSSSYAYFLIGTLPLIFYFWGRLSIKYIIIIALAAVGALINSHLLYVEEVNRITSNTLSTVPVPNLVASTQNLFNAFGYNLNLAFCYFIFSFAGLPPRLNFIKGIFLQKKIIVIFGFFMAGLFFLSLRSYGYSFHRNILIFAPILVLLLELIEEMSSNLLAYKIQMIGIAIVAIFAIARPATDGWIHVKNNFFLSEVQREISGDIRDCSQYIDRIAKPYKKIAVDINRSLEGAFLHEPNYWRYVYKPKDVDLVATVKILRGDYQDLYDLKAKYELFKHKNLLGYFKNKTCEVRIYKFDK